MPVITQSRTDPYGYLMPYRKKQTRTQDTADYLEGSTGLGANLFRLFTGQQGASGGGVGRSGSASIPRQSVQDALYDENELPPSAQITGLPGGARPSFASEVSTRNARPLGNRGVGDSLKLLLRILASGG